MTNDKLFGALRASTLAALCAGGLVLATVGCGAETGETPAPEGGDQPADTGAEKACGAKSCGEKGCGEKSCGAAGEAEQGTDKIDGEKGSGEKSCGEKSCGEKSCG